VQFVRLDHDNLPAELSQAEFADLIGVKPPMVTRYKQRGRLVMTADGKRVDVVKSIAKLRGGVDPARGGDRTSPTTRESSAAREYGDLPTAREAFGPSPAAVLVYQDEAAREKRASAQLRELELAERAGELVPAADVEFRVFNVARAAREALMSIPDRVATIVAAETDAAAVHALLTAECRKVCEQLAERQAQPEGVAV
jgi:phage terminase Nu1 subunit (DNA packaging protein)